MRSRLVLLLALLLLSGAGVPWAAAAPKPGKDDGARLDRTVRFLQDFQNDDGGWGGKAGAASSPGFTAWVGIGLAAAGINPQDQLAPGSRTLSVADYVARQGPQSSGGEAPVTTEFERIGMFANAAGMDPRDFGGRDYVRDLLARQSSVRWTPDPVAAPDPAAAAPSINGAAVPPVGPGSLPADGAASASNPVPAEPVPAGWFPHAAGGRRPGVNDTIFAVVFLAGVGGDAVREPLARAARAVEAMQRPDGTWPAVSPGDGTNVDMTGAAIQALCAARRCGTTAVARAMRWLREHQQPDGGWQAGDVRGEVAGESNAGTTPWVVGALWATGTDPTGWRRGGRDPLDFLATLQRRDGSIQWRRDRDENPIWMTAYAMPAFAGQAWPVPAPPRAAVVRREAREARRQAAEAVAERRRLRDERRSGRAGEVPDGGGAVTAGGGGRGADLFTRPQPQSRGATAGGARDTERDQDRREATQGTDGATGTAAASGPGDDGGVQNGERPQAGGAGGEAVAGQVVQEPRGTEGTAAERAIAPGLRTASAGGTTPPWATIGLSGLLVLGVAAGVRLERRPPRAVGS